MKSISKNVCVYTIYVYIYIYNNNNNNNNNNKNSKSNNSSTGNNNSTIWLFNIAMVAMAHRNRWFMVIYLLIEWWIFPWLCNK